MKKAVNHPSENKNRIQSLQWSRKLLGWESASEEARDWWKELEELNDDRTSLIVKLTGELLSREASIEDFFTACLYSGREGVQDNLSFLDLIHQDKQSEATAQVNSEGKNSQITYH